MSVISTCIQLAALNCHPTWPRGVLHYGFQIAISTQDHVYCFLARYDSGPLPFRLATHWSSQGSPSILYQWPMTKDTYSKDFSSLLLLSKEQVLYRATLNHESISYFIQSIIIFIHMKVCTKVLKTSAETFGVLKTTLPRYYNRGCTVQTYKDEK